MSELPIVSHLERIVDGLSASQSGFFILTGETGSGKSTHVPQALAARFSGKILMLEPRRVAALAIAMRVSELIGEEVGNTVGYRVRYDTKVGKSTRVEILTDAILTRMIQEDPGLTGVSAVILDEFHERSVHLDLAFALLRETLLLRPDLRVLIMSASIDTDALSAELSCPVYSVSGRTYPVDVSYDPPRRLGNGRVESLEEAMARSIVRELSGHSGSLLAFLPGLREIKQVSSRLSRMGASFPLYILHGSVPFEEQRRVLTETDSQRVILSSAIAETSLTVPGIEVVIDSGVTRRSRYDPLTGLSALETCAESEFSARQRAGRAGRTGPGRCVRLWGESEPLPREVSPEITRSDLAPVVLECALWGVTSHNSLAWLTQPPESAWKAATRLLRWIGAIDAEGRATARGRLIASLGAHPRIAAVALAGGADLASLVSGEQEQDRERLKKDLERRLGRSAPNRKDVPSQAMAILSGYPDRLARITDEGQYLFPSGRRAALRESLAAPKSAEWIVATDVDANDRVGTIHSFIPIDAKEAERFARERAERSVELWCAAGIWKPDSPLRKREVLSYGTITLTVRPVETDPGECAGFVCERVREQTLEALPWTDSARQFLARAAFARKGGHIERDPDANSLLSSLESWLTPFLGPDGTITGDAFLDALRWHLDGPRVDSLVPSRLSLPGGIARALVYDTIDPGEGPIPILETRVQDLYGVHSHPRVLGVPVLIRMLSPARRPIHVTRDLEGFWGGTWAEVRKDMKGRYPKHDWPERP